MKKQMNDATIASELAEGSAFFRRARDADQAPRRGDQPTEATVVPSAQMEAVQPTGQFAERPTGRSASRSTSRSSTMQTESTVFDTSAILGRPKAFYISEQQDQELDVAVSKLTARLKGRATQKIDRSTVVRLLLEGSNITDDATIDRLADQLVRRLVSQLTS